MLKRPLKECSHASYSAFRHPHVFSERLLCEDAVLGTGSIAVNETGKVHIPVEETANVNEGPGLGMHRCLEAAKATCGWAPENLREGSRRGLPGRRVSGSLGGPEAGQKSGFHFIPFMCFLLICFLLPPIYTYELTSVQMQMIWLPVVRPERYHGPSEKFIRLKRERSGRHNWALFPEPQSWHQALLKAAQTKSLFPNWHCPPSLLHGEEFWKEALRFILTIPSMSTVF